MEQTSQLTPKILAFSEVIDFDMNDAVWWALDMLALGYDTPNLLILASLSNEDNYFEKVKYLEKACAEVGLAFRTAEAGIISYSSFFIKQIAEGNQVKVNLSEVYRFCQAKDYTSSIYNFYLLYWAWDDFTYGENYSDYWYEATPQNIEQLVIKESRSWIIDNAILP